MTYAVCETTAAITTHLRHLGRSSQAINYHGHSPRPKTLCGLEAAWDTRSEPTTAGCKACRDAAIKEGSFR